MNIIEDRQQYAVYAWENHVLTRRGQHLKFDEIQPVVDYIWNQEGLKYPPKVQTLTGNDKAAGRGNRVGLWFKKTGADTILVIHELAHSLTSDFEYGSNWHNADFLGIYMKLLEKYAGYQLPLLIYTAKKFNLKFNLLATPPFKD